MITNIGQMINNIEKNEKIIEYLKDAYKEKTGEEIAFPTDEDLKSSNFLNEDDESIRIPNQKFSTFKDKVNSLNLPDINDKEAKSRIEKLRRLKDTKILIKKLDLSHFEKKDVTLEQVKKVNDGLKILKSVEDINISHNNLSDNYIDYIIELLVVPNLVKINLSHNNLTLACIKKFSAALKNLRHLKYLDISYNPFNREEYACLVVCQSLKDCEKLEHFGLCDSTRESAIRLVSNHPYLTSLNLEDSKYKKKSWDSLGRYLSNKKYNITRLSLKYCKIDFLYAGNYLTKAFAKNKTLVYLNLYNTGIDDVTGSMIMQSLCGHKCLTELNLGENFLSTHFCRTLGNVLKINTVFKKIDITKNYKIVNENYQFILEGLVDNQTLESLGDLIDMKIGVKYRESTEKLLLLNKKFESWQESANVKNQKIDFFMSSVGFDKLEKEKNEREKLMHSLKIKEAEEEEKENNIDINNVDNNNESLNKNKFQQKINKVINTKKMLNKIKEGNTISIKDLNLPKENSNYVETKGEELFKNIKPNLQLQRSMNNGEIYSKDINKIIEQINPNQKNYDDFIVADHLNNFNDNKSINNNNKIVVPFSIPGTNLLKESQKLMNKENEINDINNKSLKKSKRGGFNNSYRNTSNSMRKISPNTNRNTSRSKSKKKNEKKPMSILNTIASFTQEVINNDIELQKSLGIHVEESNISNNISNINNNNLRYSNLNDINSSNNIYNNNINKKNSNDELKNNKKNKDDIIGKYKLNDNKDNKNDMNESSIFNMYT